MEGKEEDVRLGANKFSEHQWPTAVDGAVAMAARGMNASCSLRP